MTDSREQAGNKDPCAFRKLSLNSSESVPVFKITLSCAKRRAQLVKWLPWQKEDPISGPLCDVSVSRHAHIVDLRTAEAETGGSLELTDQQGLHGVNPSFSAGPCLKIQRAAEDIVHHLYIHIHLHTQCMCPHVH